MVDWRILFIIFFVNVAHVALSTTRLMLTMKGYRILAPLLSMLEVIVYIIGLSIVLDNIDHPINVFVYAVGFACGIALGIRIEDWLALGYIMVTVILPIKDILEEKNEFPAMLREHGYGVTQTVGFGREGERMILEILSTRKNERNLYKLINDKEPKAFVISYEPKHISGGFWTKRINRNI